MPSFASQVAAQIKAKEDRFRKSFDPAPRTEAEERAMARVADVWNPLPDGAPPQRPAFAVDGASAHRRFHNGASFLLCQALLIGPGAEHEHVEVEVLRGGEEQDPEKAVDRLRQYCELTVARELLPRLAGGMLLMDGSLAGTVRSVCIARPGSVGALEDLRGLLLDNCLTLFETCAAQDTLLVGISKTAGQSILSRELMEGEVTKEALCDAELLTRFTDAPGFTAPVMLGRATLQGAGIPEGCDRDGRAWAERLAALPAIAVFYVRLAPGDDVLRVDVLGSGIGCTSRLTAFDSALADADTVADVVRLLVSQFGGPSVYNVPLYQVDQAVRLHDGTVNDAYLYLLRQATGARVRLDRSSRRFV
jgi:hypothetical protein